MFPSSIISFSTKSNGQVIDAQDIDIPQVEITALETKVGVDGSAVTTSLDYLVKNSASGGGGHVQAVNLGGTGQTSYNKGDLLVASSSSVLGKVAIGGDGLSLLADSSQTNGVNWGQVTATLPYAQDSGTGSVYAISPVPCILSYVPGQIYVAKITNANTVVAPALSVSSLVARKVVNIDGTALTVGQIKSSTLSMFGYDGTASVMQLLNPLASHWVYISSDTGSGSTSATCTSPDSANFAIVKCNGSGSNLARDIAVVVARTGATSVSVSYQGNSAMSNNPMTVAWSSNTLTLTASNFSSCSITAYFYT